MPFILDATTNPDKSYRNAAYRFSLTVQGTPVTRKWIEFYPKASQITRPEIINMLSLRKHVLALAQITGCLSDNDPAIRKEAATALVRIQGQEAIPTLADYMTKFTGTDDQESAKSALKTVIDSRRMPLLIPVLKDGPPAARKSVIELLAW